MLRRLAALALGCAFLSACDDGRSTVRAEGDPCADIQSIEVEVVDAAGVAFPDAVVTATHQTSARSLTGATDANGLTRAVNSTLGAGTLDVTAVGGSKITPTAAQVTWTCDDCSCTAAPERLVLTLSR